MNRQRLLPFALFVALCGLLVVAVSASRAAAPPVVINEILAGNAYTNLDPDYTNYAGWIELRNTGPSAVAVGGYRLSNDPARPALWTIPAGTSIPAGGYLLLWADGMNSGRHANFTLEMSGDLALTMADGTAVDSVSYGPQLPDVAYGRSGNEWRYFDQPTPGAANSGGLAAPDAAAPPTAAPPGGFYAAAQSVALATSEVGGVIRYTTDGSNPTAASPIYSAPITVSSPTAVRARVFAPDKLASPTATATYLVGVAPGTAVLSLATNPAHFFDNRIGIYVDGSNGIANPRCSRKIANWNQPWKRPVSVEFYDAGGALLFQQDGGVMIAGSCTRRDPQKQMEITAGAVYGDPDFSYPVFPDKAADAYTSLILRAAGQDAANTLLRDALGQQVVAGRMDVDRQAYRPVVVFINGAFWGVYGLRERMTEHFVTSNYGLGLDEFDLLEKRATVIVGSDTAWNQLYSFISSSNPADPAVYAYLKSQIDIDEYINYQIVEIYSVNPDWPHNNIRFWRAHDGGQWRWMIYDLDASFGRKGTGATTNAFKWALATRDRRAYHGLVLRRLLANPEFRAEFAQRFAAHINTTYTSPRIVGIIDDMAGAIAPHMPAHIARWKKPKSLLYWQSEVERLRAFARQRPELLRGHVNSAVGSPGTALLTLAVSGGEGDLRVAGVDVPDTYSGLHYRTLPIRLTAVPAPGYHFVRWQETGATAAETSIALSAGATMTAVFAPDGP